MTKIFYALSPSSPHLYPCPLQSQSAVNMQTISQAAGAAMVTVWGCVHYTRPHGQTSNALLHPHPLLLRPPTHTNPWDLVLGILCTVSFSKLVCEPLMTIILRNWDMHNWNLWILGEVFKFWSLWKKVSLCRCRCWAVVHGEDGGTGVGWQIFSDRMDMIGMTRDDQGVNTVTILLLLQHPSSFSL